MRLRIFDFGLILIGGAICGYGFTADEWMKGMSDVRIDPFGT